MRPERWRVNGRSRPDLRCREGEEIGAASGAYWVWSGGQLGLESRDLGVQVRLVLGQQLGVLLGVAPHLARRLLRLPLVRDAEPGLERVLGVDQAVGAADLLGRLGRLVAVVVENRDRDEMLAADRDHPTLGREIVDQLAVTGGAERLGEERRVVAELRVVAALVGAVGEIAELRETLGPLRCDLATGLLRRLQGPDPGDLLDLCLGLGEPIDDHLGGLAGDGGDGGLGDRIGDRLGDVDDGGLVLGLAVAGLTGLRGVLVLVRHGCSVSLGSRPVWLGL